VNLITNFIITNKCVILYIVFICWHFNKIGVNSLKTGITPKHVGANYVIIKYTIYRTVHLLLLTVFFILLQCTVRKPSRRWVDNIRMDLQDVGCGYMDWIGLA